MSRPSRAILILLCLAAAVAALLNSDFDDGFFSRGLKAYPPFEEAFEKQLSPSPAQEPAAQPAVPALDYAPASDLQARLQRLSTERFQSADRGRARRYITRLLQDSGWVVTPQPFGSATDAGTQGVNLVATQPDAPIAGSLVLGAHYDTVSGSPGADDNATGVVAVLETARALGQRRSPRPLTLVFFDLEEAGLLGSQAFVETYPQVAGAIILEMLGFRCDQPGCQRYPAGLPTPSQTKGTFLAAVGDRTHPQLVEAFADSAANASTPEPPLPVLTLTVPTRGPLAPDLLRSDHVPFWRAGLGAAMLTDTAEFRNPHYHQPSDEVSTLDMAFYQSAVRLVVARVYRLLWSY
ncbi:MAG: M20/M25/M40 family metallo-hydrolase [Elainellaceae cyanobacterium]